MNADQAQRVVIASAVVTGLVTSITSIAHGKRPAARPIVALVCGTVVLSMLAEPLPGVAAGLAGLMAVSAVVSNGQAAFDTIGKAA